MPEHIKYSARSKQKFINDPSLLFMSYDFADSIFASWLVCKYQFYIYVQMIREMIVANRKYCK